MKTLVDQFHCQEVEGMEYEEWLREELRELDIEITTNDYELWQKARKSSLTEENLDYMQRLPLLETVEEVEKVIQPRGSETPLFIDDNLYNTGGMWYLNQWYKNTAESTGNTNWVVKQSHGNIATKKIVLGCVNKLGCICVTKPK